MVKVDWASVLTFVKRNWKEITIIVLLLAVIGKLRYDYKQLENTYEASQQSLQNQIDGLQEIHAEELQKKETALQTYRDALELLEREYEQDRNKIEVVVEERIVEIETTIDNRKQFTENREELAEQVIDTYGFQYVP
jgi:CII-binding regulator of phage lambda lysogenization HflD